MKYVLAEISRRNISFYYCKGDNGNRAFVPYGTNGPIPLAISYLNGRFTTGVAAYKHAEEGQSEAYYNLFDLTQNKPCCGGFSGRQLVSKVITLTLDELCRDNMNASFYDRAPEITMVLLYCNDVRREEIDLVSQELEKMPFAELKVVDQALEAVKFFVKSTIDDWSAETDGMVVMSDNEDLSVKCYSLANYSLKYEHRFKGKGTDPRFEWAVNQLWHQVENQTYTAQEQAIPIIKKELVDFLASDKIEMHSLRLPDYDWQVMLSKKQYYNYSPPGGNQYITIANEVVSKANLRNETTGVVLQGYAAENKSYRSSFAADQFDPISENTESVNREIRNSILLDLMGFNEVLIVATEEVEIQWDGGSMMVGVKSLPADQPFTVQSSDSWIKTLVGLAEIGIVVERNESRIERSGTIIVSSPNKRVTKTITVKQSVEPILKVEEGKEEYVNVTDNIKEKEEKVKEPDQKDVVVDPFDNGNRKFKITSEIKSGGGFFNRTKTLTVNVEILDGKALPFDCVFTLGKGKALRLKPDEPGMFYEDCERGMRGTLTFGPYALPIPELGKTDVIYAYIWPAKNMEGNPRFRNNELIIKL